MREIGMLASVVKVDERNGLDAFGLGVELTNYMFAVYSCALFIL